MGGRVRRLFVLSVLALSFLSARFTWAANTCPWLNEATAAGFLGGSAIGTYVPGTGTTASRCTFVDSKPDAGRSLVITVEGSPRSHELLHAAAVACSASSQSVAAVGNEAFRCGPGKRMVSHAERIVGRVRDQVFSVNLVSTMKQDPILTSGELEMRIYSVAEEVAGNLF